MQQLPPPAAPLSEHGRIGTQHAREPIGSARTVIYQPGVLVGSGRAEERVYLGHCTMGQRSGKLITL